MKSFFKILYIYIINRNFIGLGIEDEFEYVNYILLEYQTIFHTNCTIVSNMKEIPST